MVILAESTISLFIQIIVLGILITAVLFKNKKKYRQHGFLMLSAVVLHLSSILAVMVPSFAAFLGGNNSINFADVLVITAMIHVFSGLFAAILGIWLVSSWRLQTALQTCFKNKRVMDLTLSLWLLDIASGAVLYYALIQRI